MKCNRINGFQALLTEHDFTVKEAKTNAKPSSRKLNSSYREPLLFNATDTLTAFSDKSYLCKNKTWFKVNSRLDWKKTAINILLAIGIFVVSWILFLFISLFLTVIFVFLMDTKYSVNLEMGWMVVLILLPPILASFLSIISTVIIFKVIRKRYNNVRLRSSKSTSLTT